MMVVKNNKGTYNIVIYILNNKRLCVINSQPLEFCEYEDAEEYLNKFKIKTTLSRTDARAKQNTKAHK